MATRLTTILVAVIVGATFIAGLIVGAQRDDASGPVDLIIVNGKVYPGGGADLQEAVAVRGNQILRVGSNREVKRLRRAQTVVLDAHGATVLPGLNDARVQLMSGALTLEHLNLSPAKTTDDIETETSPLRRRQAVDPVAARPQRRRRSAGCGERAGADKFSTTPCKTGPCSSRTKTATSPGPTRRRSSLPASLVRREIRSRGSS